MTRVAVSEDWLYIGAGVTHTTIVNSPLVEREATCLVESCGVIGGLQVRNVATLGGNVAHALPAGDGTTSLVALGAEADVAWHDGHREWLPVTQIFRGPGVSALDSTRDVLVGFRFQIGSTSAGSAFKRIMRPQGVALPVLGCAAWVQLDEERDRFTDLRICVSPVDRVPVRALAVEAGSARSVHLIRIFASCGCKRPRQATSARQQVSSQCGVPFAHDRNPSQSGSAFGHRTCAQRDCACRRRRTWLA